VVPEVTVDEWEFSTPVKATPIRARVDRSEGGSTEDLAPDLEYQGGVHLEQSPPQTQRAKSALKHANSETSPRQRASFKGQDGDSHDGDDARHRTPTARPALRLLSMRRNDTLARMHGDSPIYYAAWIAEWVTCFLFFAAHVVMLVLWARHDGNQESYVTTLFVTAIAAATYFAKACHMGDWKINGIVVPLPRYIDWITTTPLMLYEICHIAHASTGSTLMIILCDVLMIATGMIEAMIPWKPHKVIKQVWFAMSCWFYVMLLVVLHVDVAKKAEEQGQVAQDLFKKLEVLTVVVWSLYPIIVGIGRANTALITKPIEDIALCFMDVVAKIGMEGLIVAACFQGCVEKAGGH
jgi:bacteriorhodopsin